jgi:hypothetical protein
VACQISKAVLNHVALDLLHFLACCRLLKHVCNTHADFMRAQNLHVGSMLNWQGVPCALQTCTLCFANMYLVLCKHVPCALQTCTLCFANTYLVLCKHGYACIFRVPPYSTVAFKWVVAHVYEWRLCSRVCVCVCAHACTCMCLCTCVCPFTHCTPMCLCIQSTCTGSSQNLKHWHAKRKC